MAPNVLELGATTEQVDPPTVTIRGKVYPLAAPDEIRLVDQLALGRMQKLFERFESDPEGLTEAEAQAAAEGVRRGARMALPSVPAEEFDQLPDAWCVQIVKAFGDAAGTQTPASSQSEATSSTPAADSNGSMAAASVSG